jgi:hypothetical protein
MIVRTAAECPVDLSDFCGPDSLDADSRTGRSGPWDLSIARCKIPSLPALGSYTMDAHISFA